MAAKRTSDKKKAADVVVLTMSRGHALWLLGMSQIALKGMSTARVMEHERTALQFSHQMAPAPAPAPAPKKKVARRSRKKKR